MSPISLIRQASFTLLLSMASAAQAVDFQVLHSMLVNACENSLNIKTPQIGTPFIHGFMAQVGPVEPNNPAHHNLVIQGFNTILNMVIQNTSLLYMGDQAFMEP